MGENPGVGWEFGARRAWHPRWRGQCLAGHGGSHCWAASAVAGPEHPGGDRRGGAEQLEAGHEGL